jgi:hypothetical protein
MSQCLLITVEFSDDSDFDFFRDRFVWAAEEVARVAVEGDADAGEPARADGTIEVGWDAE